MTSSACPNCSPRLPNEAAHTLNRVLLLRPRPVPSITKPVHHWNADHPEARTRQNRHFFSTLLGRRNWLFAGSHSGGERAAAMYSILQNAKLNGVNPEAYLTDTLAKIAAGHPINRISELMPWVYRSTHEAAD